MHQLPESAKAQVPEHILKKAREIAKAEYSKRLKVNDFLSQIKVFLYRKLK